MAEDILRVTCPGCGVGGDVDGSAPPDPDAVAHGRLSETAYAAILGAKFK